MIRAKRLKAVVFASVLGLTVACTPIYRNHGYVPPEQDLAMVSVGQSTQDDVATMVGRPSSTGLLAGSGWYYVGSRWKFYGPRQPQEISREVVAISFNEAGVVSNVERFGLQDGNVVVLSRRVTTPNIEGLTLVKQLLGSLGRINPGQMLGGGNTDPFSGVPRPTR